MYKIFDFNLPEKHRKFIQYAEIWIKNMCKRKNEQAFSSDNLSY